MLPGAYVPPAVLSVREGFSADHSHECEGCVICGEFAYLLDNHSFRKCEIHPDNERVDYSDTQNEYCRYCETFENDFCDHWWGSCWIHSRTITCSVSTAKRIGKHVFVGYFFDEDDDTWGPWTTSVCMKCWKKIASIPNLHFRYCPACDSMVIPAKGKKCPYCRKHTLIDQPDPWEEFKAVFEHMPERWLIAWLDGGTMEITKDTMHAAVDALREVNSKRIDLSFWLHDDIDAWTEADPLEIKYTISIITRGRDFCSIVKMFCFPSSSEDPRRNACSRVIVFQDDYDRHHYLHEIYTIVKSFFDQNVNLGKWLPGYSLVYGVYEPGTRVVHRIPDDPDLAGRLLGSMQEIQRRASEKVRMG